MGTRVIKFFLNVSPQEQRKRFLERLDDPEKHWKFSTNDLSERALWPRYMAAYEDMIRHTSTPECPWYVVPADDKWFSRLIIASALVHALEGLNLQFPRPDGAGERMIKRARKLLAEEKPFRQGSDANRARR